MVTSGHSKAKLRAEIEKRGILCANCHRKEHYELPDHVGNAAEVFHDDE